MKKLEGELNLFKRSYSGVLVLIVSIFLLTSCFGKEEATIVEEKVETPEVIVEDVKDELSDEDAKTEDEVGTGAEETSEETEDLVWEDAPEVIVEDISTENEDEVMAEFEKEINELFEMVENEK